MGAACCTTKQKSQLGNNATAMVMSGATLKRKVENAKKTKMLSFDNSHVEKLDSRFVVDNLRVMHFVNCQMKTIVDDTNQGVLVAAGQSLKKVNLGCNQRKILPESFFECCPMIESLIVSSNMLKQLPQSLSQL